VPSVNQRRAVGHRRIRTKTWPGKEYSFDITKTDEIFDRLLKDGQFKLEDGHVLSSAEEVMGKKDSKWHNSWSHTTNNCVTLPRSNS